MMPRAMRRRTRLLFALGATIAVAGCRHVEPWQRESLADRRMRWSAKPERAAAREHVLSIREGTQGGHGDYGSGCGCD